MTANKLELETETAKGQKQSRTIKKVTEITGIIGPADKRETAGKMYFPKDWIGKTVKVIVLD